MTTPAQPARKPAGKPVWWRAFDFAERTLAPPLEQFVQTDAFASGVAGYLKVSRTVADTLQGAARGILSRANIPTSGDVQDLHRHLASIEARLTDLVEQANESDPPRRASGAPPRKRSGAATPPNGGRRGSA